MAKKVIIGRIIINSPHGKVVQWSDGTHSFTDEKIK